MRRTIVTVCVLALLLLVTVPADGAPSLQKGNQSSYNLSAAISFLQACNTGPLTSTNMVVCPMIAIMPSTVDINGTLGWTVMDLSSTAVSLNVTRDLTISHGDAGTSVAPTLGSFTESINLATRMATFLPLLKPDIDQALQMAQTNMATSLPQGINWTASVSMLDNSMMHRSFYTMWWVNGPLRLNQTVPVLVLPTNVTKASSVDLGSILGTRTTWTLTYSLSRPLISPDLVSTTPSSIPLGDNIELSFTFDYDQTSDLLLTANAHIRLGLGFATTIQPTQCFSTSSVSCPATSSPTIITREFGIDIQATLRLVSTTVDLTHPMTQIGSSPNGNSGSQSSTGSSSGTDTGTGPGNGLGSGTGQPASNPLQPRTSLQSLVWTPWVYGLLGIAAAALTGAGVWIARKRMKRTASNTSSTLPSV